MMPPALHTVSGNKGFSYTFIVFIMLLIGIGMAGAGKVWKKTMQREREAELLFRGNQIKMAIETYYKSGHAGMQFLPREMEDLLKDKRSLTVKRYLRQMYTDPMALDGKWDIVKSPDGRLMGVRTKSTKEPIKKKDFFPELSDKEYKEYKMSFEGKSKYNDWIFAFNPNKGQIMPTTSPMSIPSQVPTPAPSPLTPF